MKTLPIIINFVSCQHYYIYHFKKLWKAKLAMIFLKIFKSVAVRMTLEMPVKSRMSISRFITKNEDKIVQKALKQITQ